MKKTSLLRYGSIAMATVGLGLGVAAADTVDISGTNNNTDNKVTVDHSNRLTATDNSQVGVHNDTDQTVKSGNASLDDTGQGGDVSSDWAPVAPAVVIARLPLAAFRTTPRTPLI